MKIKYCLFFFISIISIKSFGQIQSSDVLFTVNNDSVYASEFIRVYNKNLELVKDESQKDVDNYLDLFVDYKLKLQEAKKIGLDKKPEYLRELSGYRKQLANNYLKDTQVTEQLIKEAYERVSYEVNASHILVKLPENAPAKDTLKAFKEILKLRDRVVNEGFENVKKEVHNGQTIFAENLGYFSGFKMVYDFESAAYNTPVGSLSQPFRTQFGYHIVMVNDKRKSRGEVEVAHIMIAKNRKSKDTTQQKPEQRIYDIYKKILQGESFENLAKEFSEDKSSSKKGGKLSPFSGGQLSSIQFEEAAFSLAKKGDISKPVETDFGWHIIKLYNKRPIESFEKMKGLLQMKVNRDSRSKLINDAFVNKLKQHYDIEDNYKALKYFNTLVDESYYKHTWVVPESLKEDRVLHVIGNKEITYGDFAIYLKNSQRKTRKHKPIHDLVNEQYTEFVNRSVLSYYEENLENENEEFANIVSEYRDGLLLFELMESQIWNASKTDTLGLKEYFTNNKEKYFLNERIDAVVASTSKEKTAKKVEKYLNQNWSQEDITKALNKKDKVHVIFTSGVMDKNHQALPLNFEFKEGVSKVYNHNNSYIVAKVKSVLPKEPLSFDDAKGRVITDYQNLIEKQWMEKLHKSYKVDINTNVLEKVKSVIKG